MKLTFTKMHGAGNDFVLIDDREGRVPWEDHFLMAALASRRTGVGCEGVILVQRSDKAKSKCAATARAASPASRARSAPLRPP